MQGMILLAGATLVGLDAGFGLVRLSSPSFWGDGVPAMLLVTTCLGYVRPRRGWPWALAVPVALWVQILGKGRAPEMMALELGGAVVLCLFATLAGSGMYDVRRARRPVDRSHAARLDEESER
jgi:hypothetical protein